MMTIVTRSLNSIVPDVCVQANTRADTGIVVVWTNYVIKNKNASGGVPEKIKCVLGLVPEKNMWGCGKKIYRLGGGGLAEEKICSRGGDSRGKKYEGGSLGKNMKVESRME